MEKFAGDKKVGSSILSGPENRFKFWAVPKLPCWLETNHLTMMTLVWSVMNVLLAYAAAHSLQWLWAVSVMIVLQYVTDLFDGELGRQRETGLIKWGFYMDHFLDFLFLCSLVFVGYKICPAGLEAWYFALLVVVGGFMVNSFLAFAATNEFQIYYWGLGPTEMRVGFIVINTFIVIRGTGDFGSLLPVTVILSATGLALNTWFIQRTLWAHDMEVKRQT